MNVSDALRKRRSTRAFLKTPVASEKLHAIFDAARWSPSGVNMQPWKVYALSGDAKNALANDLLEAFQSGQKGEMDYQYYPLQWKPEFKARQMQLGQEMFSLLGIDRGDKEKRLQQWGRNYLGFDAPTILIFTIDASLEKGSYLDYGMFLQSIMLMAEEVGLATCPQAAMVEYPNILKQHLNTQDDERFICGISIGYPDKNHIVNRLHPQRESVESFVTFLE